MRGEWRFSTAGKVIFGRGTVQRAGEVVREMGAKRALLVTDPGLVAAGLADAVENSLSANGVASDTYAGGQAKPTFAGVKACLEAVQGGDYEVLVSLGGGSNTDLAKAVAVLSRYGGSIDDYLGEHQVPGPVMPLVAVSTTAGTGSEVSGISVLADPENNRRAAIMSNHLRPLVAIYDPEMTRTCPAVVTADAGMDALTHAIEAYMVVSYRNESGPEGRPGTYHGHYPLSDMLAERAISLVGRYLRRAVYAGGDMEARENMHLASLLAGMAFSNAGLTAVHALEYSVGIATGCTHGAINALLLPFVMAYNIPGCPERLATVAQLLGERVEGLPVWAAAERAVKAVQSLKADVGIPMCLTDLGVAESELRPMAEATSQMTRLMGLNPRPLDPESLEDILREAW